MKREVKSSLLSDICLYTCGITAHVSHKATREKKSNKGKVKLWNRAFRDYADFNSLILMLKLDYPLEL